MPPKTLAFNFEFEICPDSEDANIYNNLPKLIFENPVISEGKNLCIWRQNLSVCLSVPNFQLLNHLTDCHKNLYKFLWWKSLHFRTSKFHENCNVSMMDLQFFLLFLFEDAVSNLKTANRQMVGRLMKGEYERILRSTIEVFVWRKTVIIERRF